MRLLALLPLVALLTITPFAHGQRGRKTAAVRVHHHDGDLDAARAEAKERNVPILVLAILEDEEESERFRDSALGHRDLGRVSQETLLVVVNAGEHRQVTRKYKDERGEVVEEEVCSVFGTKSCEVHRRNWDRVYLDYTAHESTDGEWKLPEALVIKPNGELHERHNEGNPPSMDTVLRSHAACAKEAGPGLTRESWKRVLRLRERAEQQAGSKEWGAAWQSWTGVLALAQAGPYHDEASAGADAALKGMRTTLDGILSRLTPEGIALAYPELRACVRTYAGSPFEKEVEATVKRVHKDDTLEPLIAEARIEEDAEDLWVESRALFEAGDEKAARRVAKKVLGKKYRETPAAEKVRRQFPDL